MYVEDLIIYVAVNNNEDKDKLQNELNELVNWANKWQLKINYDECHIIHIGNNNLYFDYNLDMHKIIVKKCKKVLRIYTDEKLLFREHVYERVNKASRMCALVLNNVENMDNSILFKLFKYFMRPW